MKRVFVTLSALVIALIACGDGDNGLSSEDKRCQELTDKADELYDDMKAAERWFSEGAISENSLWEYTLDYDNAARRAQDACPGGYNWRR